MCVFVCACVRVCACAAYIRALYTIVCIHVFSITAVLCVFQYVPPELLPTYQKEVLPLADIITPNQFEAE